MKIRDIARELGLSIGTVDRALHDRPGVSEATKMKVMSLAHEQNYHPNKIGRYLSMNKTKKISLGVIIQKEPEFFWKIIKKGLNDAEKEFSHMGMTVEIKETDTRDEQTLLAYLDELASEGVQAIIIVPANTRKIQDKINTLAEQGITIVTLNDDIENSKRLFYIGPQIHQSGRIAAEMMGKYLMGKGDVVTFGTVINSYELSERVKGFQEIITQKYPEINMIGTFSYPYHEVDKEEIKDQIRKTLDAFHGVRGVYNVNGGLLSIIGEIKMESECYRNLICVGHEIWPKVKEYLENEVIHVCISQDPYMQGYFAVKYLFEYQMDGKCPPYDRLYTRLDIITKENINNHEHYITPYYPLL